jgi:5'-3' exonuclease
MYTKILMGDVSDNIPPVCKGCGKKTAQKLAADENERTQYIQKNNCQTEFNRNMTLICMANIPSALVDEFNQSYQNDVLAL